MKIKIPVILFFTAGMVPTEEELAAGLAARAKFRNASLHDDKLEECDFVMGEVPDTYDEVPRYAAGESSITPQSGEQVGAFFLHQVARGEWSVLDEDGEQLNEEPLNKADARALALANTED